MLGSSIKPQPQSVLLLHGDHSLGVLNTLDLHQGRAAPHGGEGAFVMYREAREQIKAGNRGSQEKTAPVCLVCFSFF